jgi:hypothetical protein
MHWRPAAASHARTQEKRSAIAELLILSSVAPVNLTGSQYVALNALWTRVWSLPYIQFTANWHPGQELESRRPLCTEKRTLMPEEPPDLIECPALPRWGLWESQGSPQRRPRVTQVPSITMSRGLGGQGPGCYSGNLPPASGRWRSCHSISKAWFLNLSVRAFSVTVRTT